MPDTPEIPQHVLDLQRAYYDADQAVLDYDADRPVSIREWTDADREELERLRAAALVAMNAAWDAREAAGLTGSTNWRAVQVAAKEQHAAGSGT